MPLRDDLLNPISEENPSGVNLRYDPVTDKIKEARREDIDAPQGDWVTALKTADWNQVIKLGGDALAKKGKDLQVAVWLVEAHVRKEGFAAMPPCFNFLRDLLDQFWDSVYPEIDEDGDMEIRSAPLEWLGNNLGDQLKFLPIITNKLSWHVYQESRVVGYEADADTHEKQQTRNARIEEGKVSAEDFDAALEATSVDAMRKTRNDLNQSLEALETLSQYCDEKFADFSPSFIKTRTAIEEIVQTVKMLLGRKPGGNDDEAAEIAEPGVVDAFSVDMSWTSQENTMDAEGVAAEEGTPAGAPGDMSAAGRQLGAICKFMREQDPEDPAPYLILRSYAWARLEYNSPQFFREQIEAPPGDLRVRLKKATKDGDYDAVLEMTEAAMLQPYGRNWLDLQRYAVNALEQKGLSLTGRPIVNQLRVLIEMLPDVIDVTLPDDTPAANADTKNWIDNFVVIHKGPPPSPKDESSDSSSDSSSSDFSFDTSSSDTSSSDFSFDTSSTESTDASTDFSLDTSSSEAAAEPEPEPFVPEENPPILSEEEPPPSDMSDEFAAALHAVKYGKVEDGLGQITALLATERSGRARFRRRTQLAHLLMTAGKGKVAQPILDQLSAEIEDRKLEDWEESEALAYPLELLYRSLGRSEEERRAALYARICRLDPVRGVNCG
jgi:type VI secretion system protein ImpA